MQRETITRVGFVGLGAMGGPVAGHLLDAGFRLFVCDTDSDRLSAAEQRGATVMDGPSALADAVETIFLCLPTPAIVEQVCLGPGGLAAGGIVRRVIDHSTTGPDMARRVAGALAEKGIAYIDAPLTGSTPAARAGTLGVLVAGPPADVEAIRPCLLIYAKDVTVAGTETGQGHLLKLVNNMALCAALAATAEALVVGRKAGIALETMLDGLNRGSGRSFASEAILRDHVLAGNPRIGFKLELMRKDLRLLLEQADESGAVLPICGTVRSRFDDAQAVLGPDADVVGIAPYILAAADGLPQKL